MTTSNPTNDPKKTEKADEARIKDRPASKDFRELTPDDEKNVVGGATNYNTSRSNVFR